MIHLVDCTLRDGEQAPGVAFSTAEKVEIARLLDLTGVSQIEAGTPAMGEIEQEAIRAIVAQGLSAQVSTWNRLLPGDVEASLACGVKLVHLSGPASDLHLQSKLGKSRSWVLGAIKEVVAGARARGLEVTIGAEDASRADREFLVTIGQAAAAAGAVRLRYADTVGALEPFRACRELAYLRQRCGLELEFHGHNDFGLALANTLAAARAGVKYLDVTVLGLGERAGNAPLAATAASLTRTGRFEVEIDFRRLPALTAAVKKALEPAACQAPPDRARAAG
ncbi:MAG: homocitrate synthase [Clostridia bacterium]|nr:MAG: homocitrate synthase [Clostridia bacterium]